VVAAMRQKIKADAIAKTRTLPMANDF
jgi:hypothetical protein